MRFNPISTRGRSWVGTFPLLDGHRPAGSVAPMNEHPNDAVSQVDASFLMHCAQLDNRFDISYRYEEGTYSFGFGRRVCQAGSLTFEISISHQEMAIRKRSPWPCDSAAHRVPASLPRTARTALKRSQIPHEKADDCPSDWLRRPGETRRDRPIGATATAKAAASPCIRVVLRPPFQPTAGDTSSKADSLPLAAGGQCH